jgi:hypothetical protein
METPCRAGAYNAGLGNAAIWQQLANGDPGFCWKLFDLPKRGIIFEAFMKFFNSYKGLYSPIQ